MRQECQMVDCMLWHEEDRQDKKQMALHLSEILQDEVIRAAHNSLDGGHSKVDRMIAKHSITPKCEILPTTYFILIAQT